MEALPQLDP